MSSVPLPEVSRLVSDAIIIIPVAHVECCGDWWWAVTFYNEDIWVKHFVTAAWVSFVPLVLGQRRVSDA